MCSTANRPVRAPRCSGSAAISQHGLGGSNVIAGRRRPGDSPERVGSRPFGSVKTRWKYGHGKQLVGLRFQPPRRGGGLAGGAVAVAAGIVGDLLMPALGAPQDVTAQRRGAAGGQVLQGAALLGHQLRIVLVQELVDRTPDDLAHGGARSGHERRPPRGFRSRRSSGTLDRRQRRGGHMDVPRRGAEAAMAEQDLDGSQVGAGFEQMGGEAMAQRVDDDRFAQAGRLSGTIAGFPYAGGRDRTVIGRRREREAPLAERPSSRRGGSPAAAGRA